MAQRLRVVAETMGVDAEGLLLWALTGAVEMGASARAHGTYPPLPRTGRPRRPFDEALGPAEDLNVRVVTVRTKP